ncbi:MAG: GNAT family N-acetyltransferase [Clostridia bacterium]|nr:GNAT family N-acetyltransferase [Clostridia bacterium]
MADFIIKNYVPDYENKWDAFIENESVNGTFLHSRRFLNYHPEGRFTDASLVVFDNGGHVIAVIPACKTLENGKTIFSSHSGSTYGGIIFAKRIYEFDKVSAIIDGVENFIKTEYDQVVYKITPTLFSIEPADLIEYALYYKGYSSYSELNSYIDYSSYDKNVLSNFAQGKRTNVNNCIKKGMTFKEIFSDDEIKEFYSILSVTLKKYDKKPVHTVEELIEFKNNRLKQECAFFGTYLDGKMVAGSMNFYFKNANVAHTQYLCALPEFSKLSPMTFTYYSVIKDCMEKGYGKLSFGISTEDCGRYVNEGLTKSKEAFGGKHAVNRIYYKELK